MPPKRSSAFSGNSATGRKSATVQAKHATQAPTIQKHPRRPRAAAAVHEATHRPTTQDPSPSPPHTSVSGTDQIEALEKENASLKLSVDAVSNSLDEVKEMLRAIATNFKDGLAPSQGTILGTASAMPAYVGSMSGPRSFIGMTAEKTIQTLLPWVDATTLANIVACTLDVAHLVKLIPLEQRPKGQPTVGLAAGIHFSSTIQIPSF